MENLTYLEQKNLAAIDETHPYHFRDCEIVYKRCHSFDDTIKILEQASAQAVNPYTIMKQMNI